MIQRQEEIEGRPRCVLQHGPEGKEKGRHGSFTFVTKDKTQVNNLKKSQGGLDCTSGECFSPRGWLGAGTGCPGKRVWHKA